MSPGGEPAPPILASVSPLDEATVAIVGTGAMAEAMIGGLLSGGHVGAAQIVASDPRAERREVVEGKYGIRTSGANTEAVEGAHVVVLAIKPQMLVRVGRELSSVLRPDQLVISILAGSTTKALGNALRHDAIVRAMPNTPAQLGKGMTVWFATSHVTEQQRQQAAAMLSSLGVELEVEDEKYVSMATAVSGTGPAYVFLVMEALIDAAVHLGFPRHIAHDLVIETLLGGTLLAQASGDHPAYLRNMVTSPAGTSAAAIHEMEKGRLRTVLSEAVFAAYRRTEELGRELEEETAGE
jgi:pyrroline-5-carboxylate reductase